MIQLLRKYQCLFFLILAKKIREMFSSEDLGQMKKKGIDPATAEKQIYFFETGFPYLELDRPATPGDGIIPMDRSEADKWAALYDEESRGMTIEKFVPASGAATRMFKDLYSFLEESSASELTDLYQKYPAVQEVIEKRSSFAFYPQIKAGSSKFDQIYTTAEAQQFIAAVLTEKGLNYGNLPKGLLAFHAYADGYRTSFEEHLAEGALYAKRDTLVSHLHFTVTPEHMEMFRKLLKNVTKKYEQLYHSRFDVTFSEQSPSTDTIAVDMDNRPFRDSNGRIVFRPAGHGALLHNLNQIKSEIIFIKNIDNIVPDALKEETIRYKKALAGVLLDSVNKIDEFLYRAEDGKKIKELIDVMREFYMQRFFVSLPEDISIKEITDIFNRPVRVCGMVKNQGEPGGGPFWVRSANSSVSLQIVESSQVEKNNSVFRQSTHFNPVDLVCFVYNYKGEKFDLNRYADPETGFISVKSKDGKDLKAMELPGLWNGAMAYWNTVFVEVPLITFNPVKTINDLLRNEHCLH
jgi:hypothetical protein